MKNKVRLAEMTTLVRAERAPWREGTVTIRYFPARNPEQVQTITIEARAAPHHADGACGVGGQGGIKG